MALAEVISMVPSEVATAIGTAISAVAALGQQNPGERRHDDQAAADAEQAGQDAGEKAGQNK
jgi:hypothetical protein